MIATDLRPRRGGWGIVALLALLALLASTGGSAPAGAQPAGIQQGPADRLTLGVRSLTGVVHPDGDLRVQLTVNVPRRVSGEGLRLVATLYRKVIGRVDFAQAMQDGAFGPVWATVSTTLDPIASGTARTVDLEASAADLALFDRPDSHGVYPLQLQLLADGAAAAEVTTSLVFVPRTVEQPLRATTLLTIDEPVGRLPEGDYDRDLPQALEPRSRLGQLGRELSASLADGSGAGLTVAVSGLLLEQVADLADGFDLVTEDGTRPVPPSARAARHAGAFLERMRRVLRRADTETLALPYGPADLVALHRAGLESVAAQLVAQGRRAVEDVLAVQPDHDVLVPPDGLNPPTLEAVLAGGINTVVLGEQYLDTRAPAEGLTPVPVRRLRSPAGTAVTAVVPDPFLDDALQAAPRDDAAVAVGVQRLLAETAVTYFERPFAPEVRGLLLAPPVTWAPPPGMVTALLDGLASAPWIRPVTMAGLLNTIRPESRTVSLTYPAAARARELPAEYVAELARARTSLAPLAAVLPADDPTPGRYARQLLIAAAVHFRPGAQPEQGQARIDDVVTTLNGLAGAVRLLETPPITLTADTGQVPVTLVNQATLPLRVRVQVASAGFEFFDGDRHDLILEPDAPTTVTFRARALSPGALTPVGVAVVDPEGGRTLTTGNLAVRSTAYPLVALLVTGSAGTFLLAWWIREVSRKRQRSRGTPRAAAA